MSAARLDGGFVAGGPGHPLARPTTQPGALIVIRRRSARPVRLLGPPSGGAIGLSIAIPGDVNLDRREDVLAVAYGRRGGPTSALLLSSTSRRIARYTGLRNDVEARSNAAGAGDFDGDGRPDLIFGSPGANAAYALTAPTTR